MTMEQIIGGSQAGGEVLPTMPAAWGTFREREPWFDPSTGLQKWYDPSTRLVYETQTSSNPISGIPITNRQIREAQSATARGRGKIWGTMQMADPSTAFLGPTRGQMFAEAQPELGAEYWARSVLPGGGDIGSYTDFLRGATGRTGAPTYYNLPGFGGQAGGGGGSYGMEGGPVAGFSPWDAPARLGQQGWQDIIQQMTTAGMLPEYDPNYAAMDPSRQFQNIASFLGGIESPEARSVVEDIGSEELRGMALGAMGMGGMSPIMRRYAPSIYDRYLAQLEMQQPGILETPGRVLGDLSRRGWNVLGGTPNQFAGPVPSVTPSITPSITTGGGGGVGGAITGTIPTTPQYDLGLGGELGASEGEKYLQEQGGGSGADVYWNAPKDEQILPTLTDEQILQNKIANDPELLEKTKADKRAASDFWDPTDPRYMDLINTPQYDLGLGGELGMSEGESYLQDLGNGSGADVYWNAPSDPVVTNVGDHIYDTGGAEGGGGGEGGGTEYTSQQFDIRDHPDYRFTKDGGFLGDNAMIIVGEPGNQTIVKPKVPQGLGMLSEEEQNIFDQGAIDMTNGTSGGYFDPVTGGYQLGEANPLYTTRYGAGQFGQIAQNLPWKNPYLNRPEDYMWEGGMGGLGGTSATEWSLSDLDRLQRDIGQSASDAYGLNWGSIDRSRFGGF